MRMGTRRLSTILACLFASLLLAGAVGPSRAAAHPLGNFTINRLAKVVINADEIQVRYVIDMAEIPAFQEVRRIDKDGDGRLSDAERSSYLEALGQAVAHNIDLRAGGKRIALRQPEAGSLDLQPGQSGLDTLRIVLEFSGVPATGWQNGVSVELKDRNYAGRPGWRSIVLQAGAGVSLSQSSVPDVDETADLTAYPEALLRSPPDMREARFSFRRTDAEAGAVAAAGTPVASSKAPGKSANGFARLIARADLTPAFVLLSLLVAVAWGAAHALGPGHGKTIVAAYLVGEKGTAKHAALLGLTVTVTHTSSVFALGLATLSFSQFLDIGDLYVWLSVASGAMVLALGGGLLFSRLRRFLGSPDFIHGHSHGDHSSHPGDTHVHQPHEHLDHHHEGHGHSHAPTAPGLRGLIALGISGGLLPCPTALVVMLGAIALDRVAYGLALVLAFSVGLAGVLTAIGLLLVCARRALDGMNKRLRFVSPTLTRKALTAVPILSSVAIMIAGVLLTSSALAAA